MASKRMQRVTRCRQCGNALLEFTLVGIPLIFVLISIFEIARGMWVYTTLAHAIREGARYAVVHGDDCNIPPNGCATLVQDVAQQIRFHGVGLMPADVELRFLSQTRTPLPSASTWMTLTQALANTTAWPADAFGAATPDGIRGNPVEIRGRYRFRSALAMFWPGAGRGQTWDTHWLNASSKETVQY
jgi:hypothetical protein